MRIDRGEAQGTGLALLLHVGLVVALTTSLAHVPNAPEPPPMEVEVVDSDEVALTAAAPQPPAPAPAAQAPAPSEPTPPAPSDATLPPPQASLPQPVPTPAPTPPLTRPVRPRQTAPQPHPVAPRPTPPRQTRLGNDFLNGLGDDLAPTPQPARQGAATFSAAAKASVDQAIKRQIQPCADRQPTLGPGADGMRVVVNLRLDRSGRLSRTPTFVRSNANDDNRKFEDLAFDQAVAVFRSCSPLRLPAELYSTPQGGWANINLSYSAK